MAAVIEQIKSRFTCRDVAAMFGVNLKPGSQRCISPQHEDKNPSANYDEKADKYKCYSCDWNGDCINLYSKFANVDNKTAIKELAKKADINKNKKPVWELLNQTIYDYRDEKGNLVYQVGIKRLTNDKGEKDKNSFCQRPDGNGGYIREKGCLNGIKKIPYRLNDLHIHFSSGNRIIYIAEGEKCAEILTKKGFPATCNPFGAGKWKDEYCQYFPQDTEIIIFPDSDKPGQQHAQQVASSFISQGFEKIKIINLGYPIEEKHGKDIYDWFQEGHTPEELGKLIEKTSHFSGGEGDGIDYESLKFPVEAMPGAIIPLIRQAAVSMGTEADLIAVPILTILGAALGNNVRIQIHQGYKQKANLFTAIVSPPGSGKSPALDLAKKPVIRRQRIDGEQYEYKAEESERKWLQWKERRDSLPKGERKNFSEPEPEKLSKKHQPIYYLTDVTTEGMIACHALNPRGFVNIYDELTGLVSSLNQYKGGKGNDRQFILSLWSGGAISTVRKGREPGVGIDYMEIPDSCVSITGGIQPSELIKIIDNKGGSSDGFAQRFLFAYPDYMPSFYKETNGTPEYLEDNYQDLYDRVFEFGNTKRTLCMSPDAKDLWIKGSNKLTKEIISENLLEAEKETWCKLSGQAARIALIIHCCRMVSEEGVSGAVDIQSMAMAWALINYFKANIRKAYRELLGKKQDDKTQVILSILEKMQGCKATVRDIQRQTVKIGNSKTIRLILKQMIKKGILKELHQGRAVYYTFSDNFSEN